MNTAYVKIWGELIGAIAWDETTGIATFEYDPKFKSKGWDLSPLQMPISGTRNIYCTNAIDYYIKFTFTLILFTYICIKL